VVPLESLRSKLSLGVLQRGASSNLKDGASQLSPRISQTPFGPTAKARVWVYVPREKHHPRYRGGAPMRIPRVAPGRGFQRKVGPG
jgi:hypothetical protein